MRVQVVVEKNNNQNDQFSCSGEKKMEAKIQCATKHVLEVVATQTVLAGSEKATGENGRHLIKKDFCSLDRAFSSPC
jgi:hypothetical protein